MYYGSKRKAVALGMDFGTASNRLKKQLMFKYVCLAGDGNCFACGKPIESAEEMSVEHKIPWESRNSALFWSLDNIAFSHKHCNYSRGKIKRRRTVYPTAPAIPSSP